MCGRMPVTLVILHGLRLAADPRASPEPCRSWLRSHGLGPLVGPTRDLARLVANLSNVAVFAPPGAGAPWPYEDSLLTALGAQLGRPESSQRLLRQWLPPTAARVVDGLLAELAVTLAETRLQDSRPVVRSATQRMQ